MKAIAVVFFQAFQPETPKRQLSPRHTRAPEAQPNPDDDRSTPPFWTWFIENPRPDKRDTGTA
jgi:hypothetical protein